MSHTLQMPSVPLCAVRELFYLVLYCLPTFCNLSHPTVACYNVILIVSSHFSSVFNSSKYKYEKLASVTVVFNISGSHKSVIPRYMHLCVFEHGESEVKTTGLHNIR